MIFNYFQKFVPEKETAEDYLKDTHEKNLGNLAVGLQALTLADNLSGFFVTVTMVAGESAQVANRLDKVPTGFIVVFQKGAGQITVPTDKNWDNTALWLKNNGAVSVTAKIFFLR